MNVETELRALRAAVEVLSKQLESVQPQELYKPKDARIRLGKISAATYRRLIVAGLLNPVLVLGTWMVPASEIRRLATPLREPASTPKPRRAASRRAPPAATETEKILALAGRRR